MRKIEEQMLQAIESGKPLAQGNTVVVHRHRSCKDIIESSVYLHGNHLGYWCDYTGQFKVDIDTLRQWPTPTTKSRLRALGVDVYTKKGITYLEGVAI